MIELLSWRDVIVGNNVLKSYDDRLFEKMFCGCLINSEYLVLKQHVDQLRNKQKHLRSQRDVST